MHCPKCQAPMESVIVEQIEVDRCTACKGLWFDYREAERLCELKAAGQVDTGDPGVGAHFNRHEAVKCPRCRVTMGRMVDNDQPHIWYETCDLCHGLFFDAGEFRDYQERNLLDFFKDLLTGPRY